ncbi:hypothetical protein Hamer_G030917 [Homarus americanus]|uniref:Uncharacterized protein n=1 Tax=Homarus americanus TaxID=6706 RepID=A0A8J5MMI7_HOMAM|nr:hypothetical protein Hamer_G030917 [Homarus americanus]
MKDRRNYTDKELINDMIVPLLHQWTKANALFKPPVINQCRTIELKLTKLWHKAVETSLGKGNLARKNEFLHTLDTLFDILTCKCSIQLCSESNCSHSGKRENNSHIDCGCPREKKIPVLELEFIKAQRTKAEGQGSMQMGSIDYSETKKQIANAKKREQIREREQKKKMKSEEAIQREEELCQDVYHFFDIPPINVNATKLSELVDLSLEVLEPPLTTSLTSQELRNLKETPMQVPKWPSHTQSVERCVKMVTEAAGHVYSHERREATPRPPPPTCTLLTPPQPRPRPPPTPTTPRPPSTPTTPPPPPTPTTPCPPPSPTIPRPPPTPTTPRPPHTVTKSSYPPILLLLTSPHLLPFLIASQRSSIVSRRRIECPW